MNKFMYSVYLACSFLINLLIVLVILLITPLMAPRGIITIVTASLFVPILITSWLMRDRSHRLVPVVLCGLAAVLMSVGASIRQAYFYFIYSIIFMTTTSVPIAKRYLFHSGVFGINLTTMGTVHFSLTAQNAQSCICI